MHAVDSLSPALGVTGACEALGVPRSSLYRSRQAAAPPPAPPSSPPQTQAKSSPRALSPDERARVREALNADRFSEA